MHILIVDDNEELQYGLEKIVSEAGYVSDAALTIQEAQQKLEEKNYDLMLLDWMLPDGSGVEFLQKLRDEGYVLPVLLFSSKNEVTDKVEALDMGADDYLEKPFSNIELLARMRALLRREAPQKQSIITIGSLQVDTVQRIVTIDAKRVHLSAKEYELLEFLARNANIVLTRFQLLEHLNKDFDVTVSSNIVDAHIKNLRKKLGKPEIIETVRGVGYVIRKQ